RQVSGRRSVQGIPLTGASGGPWIGHVDVGHGRTLRHPRRRSDCQRIPRRLSLVLGFRSMSPDHVASQPRPDTDKGPAQATSDVSTSATVQWQPTVGLVEGPHGTATESLPALAIPGYEILNEEGRGGMGVVFKARHLKLNRIVALKMILHGELASEQETRRFRTEAETIARIQHPNIIQIFEIGEHEGRLFLSLEYCGGGRPGHLPRGNAP